MPKTCVYCGQEKADGEFTLEHIWPDALGGDLLPALFQTNDVCQRCNNLAGLFVDGAFLKSWFGQAERSHAANDYLNLDINSNSITPLHYMGPIADAPKATDDIYEMWLGPCGTHVIHVRDKNSDEEKWSTYASGDPIALKKKPGRIYISLTTVNPQWIALALRSVKAHFKKAARYIVNAQLPPEWKEFAAAIDRNDAQQANDLKVVEFVQDASRNNKFVRHNVSVSPDPDHRLLAKLALGLGYTILGPKLLLTDYASLLRQGMREKDHRKRAKLPIRGVGFLSPISDQQFKLLAFPGAWVIHLKKLDDFFALVVITPSGKSMTIAISDTPELWSRPEYEPYRDGVFYVVVPAAAKMAGPISAPEYLSHILKNRPHPELAAIEASRIDRASLPPCK